LNKAILDTDTLLNFFDDDENTSTNLVNYITFHSKITISILTIYEIFKGLFYKNAKKRIAKFEEFLLRCEILDVSKESVIVSANIYSELRKKGISIGEIDLLIAGIAIHRDMELITNNQAHFRHIKGLKLNNWK
jgi:predicted nucleic acid-binding protein